MRNVLRGYAQAITIALGVLASLAGCVPIPIPAHDISVSAEAPVGSMSTLVQLVRIAPSYQRELAADFSFTAYDTDSNLDIMSATDYWKVALPERPLWTGVNLPELLGQEATEHARAAGINHLLVLSALVHEKERVINEMGIFGGVSLNTVTYALPFMLIDLARVDEPRSFVAKAKGEAGAVVVIPVMVFTAPDVHRAVMGAAVGKVAEIVSASGASAPFRIAVLGERDHYLQPNSEDARMVAKAEAGDADAEYELYTRSVADNLHWSHAWLCKAADQGNFSARYRLGWLYQDGREGLRADPVSAYVWYQLAASSATPDLSAELTARSASPDRASRLEAAVESAMVSGLETVIGSVTATLTQTGKLADAQSRLERWRPGRCAEMM